MLQTRWYLIRPPSLACTCRNEMSWLSVAAYSFTGTLTSPNDTAPFQIALGMPCSCLSPVAAPVPRGAWRYAGSNSSET